MDYATLESSIPPNAQTARDLELPANAAERKRVLNILAQRRYRRRRREKQAELEKMASRVTDKASIPPPHHLGPETDHSSGNSTDSPSSQDSNASSDLIVPYTNGSAWWPLDTDPCIDIDSLFANNTLWTPTELNPSSLTSFLQTDDIQSTTFPDDHTLSVPSLDLLRAAYAIATRLHSSHLLFAGLDAQSIFTTSPPSTHSWIPTLPPNLRPTKLQLTTPHHPLLDCLPWPAVRDKLISMYTLPIDLWPKHPSDGSPASVLRLVYDMEDGGVRISGENPTEEGAWEVEQGFFDVWWWALDWRVVKGTDGRRRERGEGRLRVEPIPDTEAGFA